MKGKQKNNGQTTVRGILIPMGWNENGRVVAIGLSGTDESQRLIEKNEKLGELLGLIQMEVELRGLLREQSGKEIILVKRCNKILRTTPPRTRERR
jgi:hypothetical protein